MLIVPVYNFIVLPYTEIILQIDKLKEINNDEIKVASANGYWYPDGMGNQYNVTKNGLYNRVSNLMCPNA